MKKHKFLTKIVLGIILTVLPGNDFFTEIPVTLAEPENCHLITSPDEFGNTNAYAPPYDVFSEAHPLLLEAVCDASEITLSFTGTDGQRIFSEGYLYEESLWKPFRFPGANEPEYIPAPAQAVLTRRDNGRLFAVFFACSAIDGEWKCGCQDEICKKPYWNIQAIKPPRPVAQNFYHPAEGMLQKIRLPEGFFIHEYAKNVENARSLALGSEGIVFVGSRTAGRVYALADENGDMKADKTFEIASGLTEPNGVAFKDGDLYVAEISRILRFDDIVTRLNDPPEPVIIYDRLPRDRSHGWKYLAIGPDDKLYFGIGAPCNTCERDDERYATIVRMNLDGSGFETVARGVRNSVGFDWQPQTGVLYFTDNGRDMIGDDNPPDELNRLTFPDTHYGFPYCHGAKVMDPEFGRRGICDEYEPPVLELGPHVAALGMKFYDGEMFPSQYRGKVFIAEHGSWNRSRKIGYRVTVADLTGGQSESYLPFAEGWLENENHWGRPVDVLELPDGSILVSDDFNDAVYRIGYLRD